MKIEPTTGSPVVEGFGAAFKAARARAGISQRQLGIRAGVSPAYICHVEAERRNPTVIMLEQLAGVLGCAVVDLVPESWRRA